MGQKHEGIEKTGGDKSDKKSEEMMWDMKIIVKYGSYFLLCQFISG